MADAIAVIQDYTSVIVSGGVMSGNLDYAAYNGAGSAVIGGSPAFSFDLVLSSQKQIEDALIDVVKTAAALGGVNIVRVIFQASAFVVRDA